MNYFIADLHIGDENVAKYEHRPFKNIDIMRDEIIKRWNSKVTSTDTVYLLGDIGEASVLKELNGEIIIVIGNHDNYDTLKSMYPNIYISKYPIMVNSKYWLSHEPIGYMPPEIPYLNIHGHLHRFNYGLLTRDWQKGNRYFCVSVEQIDFTPISEDEIAQELNFKEANN